MAKKKAEAVERRYELPSKKPSPLFESMAEKYLRYYRANRRPRPVRRHEMAYRALAMEWGKASDNPVKKVRLYREENARTRFLTDEEEARLLACCRPQLKPLVVTALHTGFRASELLSLTWGDIDFRPKTASVRAGYAKNGEGRSVPLNDTLTRLLKSAKVNAAEGERVFCNRYGQPYRSFRTTFERAVRQAGIQDFTFHDLQHMFASRLVIAGVDLPTVKELLGHKDISMTLRYAHLPSDHKRAAVK